MGSLKSYAYRFARAAMYRGFVPVVSQNKILDYQAHRLTRRLARSAVFTSRIPSPLVIDGLSLYHNNLRPSFTLRALSLGSYEPYVAQAIRARCVEGATVLDVGAHLGYHTLLAARSVGSTGHVWAFEPDPDNRELLLKNVQANQVDDRVSVIAAALGSAAGNATLHRASSDSGGSTLVGIADATHDMPVEVTTLDAWAADHGWPRVDVVKIDVEGVEPEVLRGMTQLVHRNPTLAVIVECQKSSLERVGGNAMRLFDALRELSLVSIKVLDDHRGVRPMRHWADAAAILELSRWYPINLCCTQRAMIDQDP